jgi:hypothetical protein
MFWSNQTAKNHGPGIRAVADGYVAAAAYDSTFQTG